MRLRIIFLALLLVSGPLAGQTSWVSTWAAGPAPQLPDPSQMAAAHLIFNNQTLRQVVHTSIGSITVRVRLSNVYGQDPVEIGAAHIARQDSGSNIVPESDQILSFSGRRSVIIPPNAILISDPVALDVPPTGNLTISLFFPNPATGAGIHYLALSTQYIGNGDQTAARTFTRTTTISSWVFLAGVDVIAADTASAIVALGDSITDGANSTSNTNQRWPNFLAARLQAAGELGTAVLDAGISGNRVLHDAIVNVRDGASALARFDRDVFSHPGVKYLIILEGINDIGQPGTTSADISETVSAEDIIAGLQQMADRAHERGLKVFGATLTPFQPATSVGYFSPDKEVLRETVNAWIRTGVAFDAVIDFDRALQDPAHPNQMLPAYDSGDHLHPGNAGYQAMADSIDLSIFQ